MEEIDGYDYDENLRSQIIKSRQVPNPVVIAGCDEAGRGPLAGPVVAAAVILPPNPRIVGLRDSKIIPLEQREALYCEIQETALAIEVSVIDHSTIDSINILQASLLAMRNCVEALALTPAMVIVDGNQKPRSRYPEQTIVKGDGLSASIMAASIIAKVTRDHIMNDMHDLYPMYGFNEHKGYGAPQHLEAIQKHGPCPIHRRSFEPVRSWACPN